MAEIELSLAAPSWKTEPDPVMRRVRGTGRGLCRILPGIGLCITVSLVALGLEAVERQLFGRSWLEALVLAIVIGATVRTLWTPGSRWCPGVDFSARMLLEVAVMLLGASVSFRSLTAVGPGLLFGIGAVVTLAIPTSFLICRMLGLPPRLSVLVACGNSICGNSAIAAVAPVIGANGGEVAASIAFTAVLGVLVVLGLPLLGTALLLTNTQFGVLTGLTVYAVPQVIAAAAPGGAIAVQIGTLVKLVRVLMLGPVMLMVSLLASRFHSEADEPRRPPVRARVAAHRIVPWFILGFLGLSTLRSFDLLGTPILSPAARLADGLTILSMAALGLGVDVKVVASAGARVTTAVTVSLVALGALSLTLIHLLRVA